MDTISDDTVRAAPTARAWTRIRAVLLSGGTADERAVGDRSVTDILGEWHLAATTLGFFERPRLGDAHIRLSRRNDREVDCATTFERRGRTVQVRAIIGAHPDRRGFHRWRGRGGYVFAARGRWGVTCSPDRSVAAIHHPSSMSSDGGAAILVRPGVDGKAARRLIERNLGALHLSRGDFLDLSWRI